MFHFGVRPLKFTVLFNSPVSLEKADRIIDLFDLKPKARVIDMGCGEGEFLLRTMSKYNAEGFGVDPDHEALQVCRMRSKGRVIPEQLHLYPTKGADFDWPGKPFDLAICIGSSHAFGGYVPTLQKLKDHVCLGGFILMGEIFWRSKPVPDYEKFLGEGWPAFDINHHSYVSAGETENLLALYSVRSSEDEWDHFEGSFTMKRFHTALGQPDVETRIASLDKIKRWRDAYLKWGYSTIGFGLYLYQRTS